MCLEQPRGLAFHCRAATSSKTQAFAAVLNSAADAPDLSDCLRVLRWPLRDRQLGVALKRYASALRGFQACSGRSESVFQVCLGCQDSSLKQRSVRWRNDALAQQSVRPSLGALC